MLVADFGNFEFEVHLFLGHGCCLMVLVHLYATLAGVWVTFVSSGGHRIVVVRISWPHSLGSGAGVDGNSVLLRPWRLVHNLYSPYFLIQ